MKSLFQLLIVSVSIVSCLYSCETYEKDLPASEIYINMPDDGYELNVNDTLVLSPKITYDQSSSYQWILDGNIVSTDKNYTLIPKELKKYVFTFEVTNDRGSDKMEVVVQSMYKTDFEDIVFDKDSFWTNIENQESFISEQLVFESNNSYFSTNWTGFTYSNLVGNQTEEDDEKYSAYTKPSEFESTVLGVMMFDQVGTPITVQTLDQENHLFESIELCNSYYLYNSIKNGTNGSVKFGGDTGLNMDWLILSVSGFTKENTNTGTINIYLANYTFGNNRDNYILDTWGTVNLESLGKISRLEFSLHSSDTENGVMNTPPYICFDELKIIK